MVSNLSKPKDDLEHQLIELVKYDSKIFTEPDIKKKKGSNTPPKIYIKALFDILSAFKDRRTFDRFGFDLPQIQSQKSTNIRHVTDYSELFYDPPVQDWVYSELRVLLTEFVPSNNLTYLLEERIEFHS